MHDGPVIQLEQLTKRYPDSSVDALHDMSLEVLPGQVFGFLGPNGAGKSTTINMLIGLIQPTSGAVRLFGQDIMTHGRLARKDIGYLTGDMALDNGLTGWQQLSYIGNLRGGVNTQYMKELATRLDCKLDTKIKALSRGNKQKVGLIAALMHKPKLLILDEPTSGLDPLVQMEFQKIVLEHQAHGGTTFISSHVLSEVQDLCDQVAIVRKGRLITNKLLHEIVSEAPKHVRLATTSRMPAERLKALKGVSRVHAEGQYISFTFKGDIDMLTKTLAKLQLSSLTITDTDLEEIFRKYYEGHHA